MKTTRRKFVQTVGAGALGAGLAPRLAFGRAPAVRGGSGYDVAVVGAGVFGSWIALQLARSGRRVALVDAYGPANARSSSGGQTRVIRMGYGDKEIYSRWSLRSLELWKELLTESARTTFFQKTGVLWMARGMDPLTVQTLKTLERFGVPHERLGRPELVARWPQIDFGPITWAILEPDSGFMMAFHAVQATALRAEAMGAVYHPARVARPTAAGGRLDALATTAGDSLSAGSYVFACGPWLPKLFPGVLGDRFFVTRQEVFYLGPPAGDERFRVGALPVWADFGEEIYGLPDFKGRGFKIAPDRHGAPIDPDSLERVVSAEATARVLDYAGRRFPALEGAPIVNSEVCQYTNTSNGDFLIDRHPELDNVWLVGGGSGHGFKHGPAIGEYVAALVEGTRSVEARFSLATKQTVQNRAVF